MIPTAASERRSASGLAAIVALVLVLPAVLVFVASFRGERGWTLGAYMPFFHDMRPWRLLWNSFCVATGTALLATCVGTLFAVSVYSVRPKLAKILLGLGALPLLIPPYIAAMAWIEWAGRRGVIRTIMGGSQFGEGAWFSLYGVGGVIAVLAASYFPIVLFYVWSSMSRIRHSLVEAAWMHMTPRTALWHVVLPNAGGGIATGMFVVFMIALANYTVPSLLLVEVYPVEVHTQFSAFYDVERATAAAVPLLGLALAGVAMWRMVLRRLQPVPRQTNVSTPRYRAGLQPVPMLATLTAVVVSSVAPIAVLGDRAGDGSAYGEVFATAHEEIMASLVLSSVSATILVALSWLFALLASASAIMRWTSRALLVPFVLSGPLYGVGLILAYNHPDPRAIVFDGVGIVILACVARFQYFAVQAGAAAFQTILPAWVESASVAGQPWWRRFLWIQVPLTAPWAVAVWTVAFVLVFGEADAIVLVAPPGFTPIPARLHSLMHYGPSAYVAALSLIVAAILVVAVSLSCLVWMILRKLFYARYRLA